MSSLYLVFELAEPIWAVDEDAIAFVASEDTNDIAEGGNELNDELCGQKSAIADCVRLRVEDGLLRFPSLLRPSFLSVSWLLCSRAIIFPPTGFALSDFASRIPARVVAACASHSIIKQLLSLIIILGQWPLPF